MLIKVYTESSKRLNLLLFKFKWFKTLNVLLFKLKWFKKLNLLLFPEKFVLKHRSVLGKAHWLEEDFCLDGLRKHRRKKRWKSKCFSFSFFNRKALTKEEKILSEMVIAEAHKRVIWQLLLRRWLDSWKSGLLDG